MDTDLLSHMLYKLFSRYLLSILYLKAFHALYMLLEDILKSNNLN